MSMESPRKDTEPDVCVCLLTPGHHGKCCLLWVLLTALVTVQLLLYHQQLPTNTHLYERMQFAKHTHTQYW